MSGCEGQGCSVGRHRRVLEGPCEDSLGPVETMKAGRLGKLSKWVTIGMGKSMAESTISCS